MGLLGMVIASAYDMNPIQRVSYHKLKAQFSNGADIQQKKL